MTASFLLHDVYAVKRGDFVMVRAAAGGGGQILSRWAKALGAIVIGSVSISAKVDAAKRSGCDHVIVSEREDFADGVLRLTSGRAAQVVCDAIGKVTFQGSLRALAPRGCRVSFCQASSDVGAYSIGQLASGSIRLTRPNYGHFTDTAEKLKTQTDRLFVSLQAGVLVVERPKVYPLVGARAAHEDLESRKTTGALVLIP